MRVMMIVKASPESESSVMPTTNELREMGEYNAELVKAGILLGCEGLHPSAKGKSVRFDGAQRTVVDGPFAESKELVAGFWLLEVRSMDEAVAWARHIPFREGEVELRQVFDMEEFAPADPTGELRAAERRLAEQLAAQRAAAAGV